VLVIQLIVCIGVKDKRYFFNRLFAGGDASVEKQQGNE
jgi:hypothetical protein